MWQWFRFLVEQVPNDTDILRLNLDETSIKFWHQPRLGLRRRTRDRLGGGKFARHTSRGQLRRAFTHVAVICDDPSVQRHLPQIMIVNEHTMRARSYSTWRALPDSGAVLWRKKSAWINNAVFPAVLRQVGRAVRAHAPKKQAILLMDAHMCHFSDATLEAAYSQNLWPCVIPASTTSVLQPLDTHVFARFKMLLRTRLHQAMCTGVNRDLTTDQVLDALMHCMRGVLQTHDWAPAFSANGFGPDVRASAHVLHALEWPSLPPIPTDLPSLEQFQSCFPANRDVPFMGLLRGVLPKAERPKRAQPKAVPDAVAEPEPWGKRLRPRDGGRAVKPTAAPLAAAPSTAAPPPGGSEPLLATSSEGRALPTLKRMRPSRLRRLNSKSEV